MLQTIGQHLAAWFRLRISGLIQRAGDPARSRPHLGRPAALADQDDHDGRTSFTIPFPDALEAALSQRKLLVAHRAIEQLPDRSRLVFLMSRVDGMDLAAIARELRMSKRAVRRAMRLAVSTIDRAYQSAELAEPSQADEADI